MSIPSEIYWEYDEKVIKPMVDEVRKSLKFVFNEKLTMRLATKNRNRRKSMSKRVIGYWNYVIVDSREEIIGVMAISLYKSLDSGHLLGIWLQLYEVALEIEYGGKDPEGLSETILKGIIKLLVYNLEDEIEVEEYLEKLNLD